MKLMLGFEKAVFRDGLAKLLDTVKGISIVAKCGNKSEILPQSLQKKPDIILLDNSWKGSKIIPSILNLLPDTKIIVIGNSEADDNIYTIFEAGAKGYLHDDVSLESIVMVLNLVMDDVIVIPQSIARGIKRIVGYQKDARLKLEDIAHIGLTQREKDILQLLAKGLHNKQIADLMSISENTAKVHVRHLLLKLGITSRSQAAQIAKYINSSLTV